MTEALLGLAAMLALSWLRIPIAISMGLVGFLGLWWMRGLGPSMASATTVVYETGFEYTLSVVPLFILMGNFVTRAGMSKELFRAAYTFVGHLRGGLAMATVLACAGFGAICGSSIATAATMTKVAYPSMRGHGYSDELAVGTIAAGGTLGILIPPSLTLILYGLASEQSIGRLFMAGFGPGLMLTLLFAIWVVFKFRMERKAALQIARTHGTTSAILEDEHFTWKDRLQSLPRFMPFLILIAVIMIAMYDGWATPSEVAGIGAAGSIILVVTLYGCYRREDLGAILSGTVRESTMIMMIICTSFLFTYVMSYLGITQGAAQWLVAMNLGKWQFFI